MRPEEFNDLLDETIVKIMRLQGSKGKEYSRNNDRLSNIKRSAAMLQCHPASAVVGVWVKHITSIFDMVDDLENGEGHPEEMWDEKILDAIVYLILLKAVIREGV